ncbi:MAG: glycine oxidase ThiO [Haloechinothrix sp.]
MVGKSRIAVVGGGVIGLSVAWRTAAAGYAVTLIDPTPGRGASWVAGGMLAPVTEAWPGEEAVLRLGEESLRRWPEFAGRLAAEGADPALSMAGTVVAAFDRADAAQLEIVAEYLQSVGRTVDVLTGRQLRSRVPGLSTALRSGLWVPGDLAVDNRKLLDALRVAGQHNGVRVVAETAVEVTAHRVVTDQATHDVDAVVITAGARSAALHAELADVIRPLKGEILRLRPRRSSLPPPAVTIRAIVEGRPIYLVPRADGEVVLGATQYEAGFDETVTARGVRELLEGAERVFPSIGEYELVEAAAGLRAASTDNLPLIGALSDGVLVASGHYRNGLLLAPITADAVLAQLDGREPPAHIAAAHPNRQLTRREERV